MIPKIIHQTWKSNILPPIIKSIYDENVKKLKNKGYEFRLWSDKDITNLINLHYPNFYNIYASARTGVQRGDISRIIIIYHYGGIYIDLDVLVMRDFEELLDLKCDKFYISYEPSCQTKALYNDDKYICNAFFAANKNNIFVKRLLDDIPININHHGYNIFSKFDIFGGNYIKMQIEKYKKTNNSDDTIHIIEDRELIYPINDLKLDNILFSENDWNMVKSGKYQMNPIMIHYWIHGDFESKNLINNFKINNKLDFNQNIYSFFKTLYPNIAIKY
tara:strand:+ start:4132 stop:4956 length:825 start_codon:yes stop_codon:yes gene_type:complete